MKKSKSIILIVSILLSISLMIGFISIRYINKVSGFNNWFSTIGSHEETVNILKNDNNSINKNKYYGIASRYGAEDYPSFFEFFDSENSLERLKNLNKYLNENFDYLELAFQSLYYIGYYDGEEKFTKSYGTDLDTVNQVIADEKGKKMYVTDIKTMQLGKNYYKVFDNRIDIGRNFNIDDYNINDNNKEVNIILGNDYLQYYKLGDIIRLSLHQKLIDFKVIGFYKKDAFINWQNTDINLNQYIVMPFYEINYDPVDDKDSLYQKIFYSQKNEGYIRISESIKEDDNLIYKNYLNKIEEISNKYKLIYTLATMPLSINLNPWPV